MSFKCANHRDRDAITKCEECQKPICLECKKIYNKVHGGSLENRYSVRMELCPHCYQEKQTRVSGLNVNFLGNISKSIIGIGIVMLIIFIVFLVIFFSFFLSIFNRFP